MIARNEAVAEETIWCASMSISQSQWQAAETEMRAIEIAMPGLKFDVPGAWAYHNGGYCYKEIRVGHRWPGRAFEAIEQIALAICHISPWEK